MNNDTLKDKVTRVFYSCKNMTQLETAVCYGELAAKSIGGFHHDDFLEVYESYCFMMGVFFQKQKDRP